MHIKLTKLAALIISVGLIGCDQDENAGAAPSAPPPSVVTEPVQTRDVSSMVEFVGRSEASQRVDIRARVSGVLLERPFAEGMQVNEGDLLFSIDPAEFKANLAAARAEVAKAEASVEEANNNLDRYRELVKRDVASRAKFDNAKANFGTAVAELDAAKAQQQRAELDLSYTQIQSPLSGRSGRAQVDVGNLIGPDSGNLVTVIDLDPIHIIFSISEREYLNYQERRIADANPEVTTKIRLANGEIYPFEGTVDLLDNEVNSTTGTINVRLTFPNPDRILVPGQFVNVLLVSKEPQEKIVVPQAAVQENQSGPFVLLVDGENRVALRAVQTGQRVAKNIVISDGLQVGETIIVDGIQKVRPGAVVQPVQADAANGAASSTQ